MKFVELIQMDGKLVVINAFRIKSVMEVNFGGDPSGKTKCLRVDVDGVGQLYVKNKYDDFKAVFGVEGV